MAIRMRRGNLADFDPTKQLSGEFGVSIDNSAGNQKVFMAFGNGNVKELMTVEDAEAQIGEFVDDAVDAAIGEVIDTATEAAETATAAAQTATTQAGTATTKAGEAASSASSASADATSAAGSAASADDSAEDSEAWAVGQRDGQDVPATDETYHNNAKYWAEQASQAAGGGVTSFNGRSGIVVPASGDYTAEMVGLGDVDNTSDMDKPISTATQTALNGKADTSSLTDGSVTKIGTGTVGSATQLIYLEDGEPTPGNEVMAAFRASIYVSNLDNAPVGFATFTPNATNAPHISWGAVMTYTIFDHSDYEIQVASKYNTDELWSRVKNNGTWTSWRQISRTNNVGSPTVPTYINAGVPTAIEAVDKVKEVRNALGDANTLNALNTVNFTEIFNGSHTPAESTSESYMYLTGQGGDANNGGVQIAVGAYPSTNNKIFYRRYNGGSWGPWKQIYGIITGTPTNVNSNLSFSSGTSTLNKSGNVVTFRLVFTISSTWTPSASNEEVCTLPWAASGRYASITRYVADGNNRNGVIQHADIDNKKITVGASPWTELVAGQYVTYYGTYLTND